MDTILQDIRFALRSLRRSPGLVLVATLSLALGIAVNVTLFAAVDIMLLRPLPYEESERMVQLWSTNLSRGWDQTSISLADYRVPDFLIDAVDLVFDLRDGTTTVRATLDLRRNAAAGTPDAPLVLDGQDLELVRVALDISGRPYLVWKLRFTQEKLGEWDTELVEHWFHSVAQAAGITLHVQLLYGQNNHHVCEAAYKGFARAMRQAVERDPRKGGAVPSTKGQLGG